MLRLFISNVAGLRECQTLAVCKVYFGPDKCDKRKNIRDIIELKSSIVNKHHKACADYVIVERFRR